MYLCTYAQWTARYCPDSADFASCLCHTRCSSFFIIHRCISSLPSIWLHSANPPIWQIRIIYQMWKTSLWCQVANVIWPFIVSLQYGMVINSIVRVLPIISYRWKLNFGARKKEQMCTWTPKTEKTSKECYSNWKMLEACYPTCLKVYEVFISFLFVFAFFLVSMLWTKRVLQYTMHPDSVDSE